MRQYRTETARAERAEAGPRARAAAAGAAAAAPAQRRQRRRRAAARPRSGARRGAARPGRRRRRRRRDLRRPRRGRQGQDRGLQDRRGARSRRRPRRPRRRRPRRSARRRSPPIRPRCSRSRSGRARTCRRAAVLDGYLDRTDVTADAKVATLGELAAAVARMEFLLGTLYHQGTKAKWETDNSGVFPDAYDAAIGGGDQPWCTKFAGYAYTRLGFKANKKGDDVGVHVRLAAAPLVDRGQGRRQQADHGRRPDRRGRGRHRQRADRQGRVEAAAQGPQGGQDRRGSADVHRDLLHHPSGPAGGRHRRQAARRRRGHQRVHRRQEPHDAGRELRRGVRTSSTRSRATSATRSAGARSTSRTRSTSRRSSSSRAWARSSSARTRRRRAAPGATGTSTDGGPGFFGGLVTRRAERCSTAPSC